MAKHERDSAERIARAAVYDMLEAGAEPADVLILVEEAMQAFRDAGGPSRDKRWALGVSITGIRAILDPPLD